MANIASNNVSVINGATNTVVATVNAGPNPDAIAVNPSTNLIYVANVSSNNVSVINGATNTIVATVSVGYTPYGVAVNPSTNLIYVANFSSNNVSVINGATNSAVAMVSVGPNPQGVTVNPSTNLIYVASDLRNNVSVIDGTTNSIVATVSVGTQPNGITVNPSTNRIYVANQLYGTVSVIQDGITVTTPSLPDSIGGTAYSPQTLSASGGTVDCTWSITSGNLPDGFSLNANTGVITGQTAHAYATSPDTYSFTVQVTDADNETATQLLTITVDPPAWDVNDDGITNISDVVNIGLHWNATLGSPNYAANCDIDGNGVININDVVMVGLHWNQTW